jgi:hypothetical protein
MKPNAEEGYTQKTPRTLAMRPPFVKKAFRVRGETAICVQGKKQRDLLKGKR